MTSDRRACQDPSVWCGACGRPYKNETSLDAHGYAKHRGIPRKVWNPRPAAMPPAPADPAESAAPLRVGRCVDVSHETTVTPGSSPPAAGAPGRGDGSFYTGDGSAAGRKWPARSDRNNAEILAGLPWFSYPKDVGACDEALDTLAVALERSDRGLAFFLSLRAIVTELRKRLLGAAV